MWTGRSRGTRARSEHCWYALQHSSEPLKCSKHLLRAIYSLCHLSCSYCMYMCSLYICVKLHVSLKKKKSHFSTVELIKDFFLSKIFKSNFMFGLITGNFVLIENQLKQKRKVTVTFQWCKLLFYCSINSMFCSGCAFVSLCFHWLCINTLLIYN